MRAIWNSFCPPVSLTDHDTWTGLETKYYSYPFVQLTDIFTLSKILLRPSTRNWSLCGQKHGSPGGNSDSHLRHGLCLVIPDQWDLFLKWIGIIPTPGLFLQRFTGHQPLHQRENFLIEITSSAQKFANFFDLAAKDGSPIILSLSLFIMLRTEPLSPTPSTPKSQSQRIQTPVTAPPPPRLGLFDDERISLGMVSGTRLSVPGLNSDLHTCDYPTFRLLPRKGDSDSEELFFRWSIDLCLLRLETSQSVASAAIAMAGFHSYALLHVMLYHVKL